MDDEFSTPSVYSPVETDITSTVCATEPYPPSDNDEPLDAAGEPQIDVELDAAGVGEEDGRAREWARIVEALLFSSDTPLSAGKLSDLAGIGSARIARTLIRDLNRRYEVADLTFRIETIAGGYQMMTLPDFKEFVKRLTTVRNHARLSNAAMEALSIVAYKQPITRSDVESIRGVASGEVLNRLRELGLIKIVGRAEIVGRPMLYGTTRKFLDVFGLAGLDDLPPLEALAMRPVPKKNGKANALATTEPSDASEPDQGGESGD
jgi:segregation and condensation protein B